jgi:hypothetical protein
MIAISAELLILTVKGLVTLGVASRDAYEQHVRDRPLDIPLIKGVEFTTIDSAASFFRINKPLLVAAGGPYAEYWNQGNNLPKRECTAEIIEAHLKELRRLPPDGAALKRDSGFASAGSMILVQWPNNQAPPPPGWRVALALAGVALDFVSLRPDLLGTSGNAAELLQAVAGNLHEALPDVGDETNWQANWGRHTFGEALLAVVFRAGLKTLAANTGLVAEHGPLKAVIQSLVVPLSARFETAFKNSDFSGQVRMERIRDTLLPELAAAAINALATNHEGLFGVQLTKDQPALTAVVAGMLDAIASDGSIDPEEVFSRELLMTVWRGALGVVTAHPELFIAPGPDAATETERTRRAQTLVGAISRKLAEASPLLLGRGALDRSFLLGVAGLVLDTVKDVVPLLLDQNKPWEDLAGDLSIAVIDSLKSGLGAGGLAVAIRRLGTRDQLLGFVGVFLSQASTTPEMLVGGSANDELKAVIAAVASTMALKGANLVHPAGWLAVAATAAEAASRNPLRLFKLGPKAVDQLGAQVIGLVLGAAAKEFNERGRTAGTFLFGSTLVEILQRSLAEAASNVDAASTEAGRRNLEALLRRLAKLGADKKGEIGARELRWLFATLCAQALTGHDFTNESDDDLLKTLADPAEQARLLIA